MRRRRLFDETILSKSGQERGDLMAKRTASKNREEILLQALLTCPNVTQVSEKTGIARTTIYDIMKRDGFRERLAEARQEAVSDAVGYLQGSLMECSEVLMAIVRDKEAPPQVRINAANSVFQNAKGLTKDNSGAVMGMAVRIVDSI